MKRLIFTILIAVATVSMLRAQEPTSPEAIPSSRLQDSLSATPVPTTVPVIEELPAPTFYADLSLGFPGTSETTIPADETENRP